MPIPSGWESAARRWAVLRSLVPRVGIGSNQRTSRQSAPGSRPSASVTQELGAFRSGRRLGRWALPREGPRGSLESRLPGGAAASHRCPVRFSCAARTCAWTSESRVIASTMIVTSPRVRRASAARRSRSMRHRDLELPSPCGLQCAHAGDPAGRAAVRRGRGGRPDRGAPRAAAQGPRHGAGAAARESRRTSERSMRLTSELGDAEPPRDLGLARARRRSGRGAALGRVVGGARSPGGSPRGAGSSGSPPCPDGPMAVLTAWLSRGGSRFGEARSDNGAAPGCCDSYALPPPQCTCATCTLRHKPTNRAGITRATIRRSSPHREGRRH